MKLTNKQIAINKAAKLNEKLNNEGAFSPRYTVAEDIRTGKYVAARMNDIYNSQYLRLTLNN